MHPRARSYANVKNRTQFPARSLTTSVHAHRPLSATCRLFTLSSFLYFRINPTKSLKKSSHYISDHKSGKVLPMKFSRVPDDDRRIASNGYFLNFARFTKMNVSVMGENRQQRIKIPVDMKENDGQQACAIVFNSYLREPSQEYRQ